MQDVEWTTKITFTSEDIDAKIDKFFEDWKQDPMSLQKLLINLYLEGVKDGMGRFGYRLVSIDKFTQ